MCVCARTLVQICLGMYIHLYECAETRVQVTCMCTSTHVCLPEQNKPRYTSFCSNGATPASGEKSVLLTVQFLAVCVWMGGWKWEMRNGRPHGGGG